MSEIPTLPRYKLNPDHEDNQPFTRYIWGGHNGLDMDAQYTTFGRLSDTDTYVMYNIWTGKLVPGAHKLERFLPL